MKKQSIILLLIFFSIKFTTAQESYIANGAGKKLKKTTTLVVLPDEQGDFEQKLIGIMDEHWTFNKVEYIKPGQVQEYRKNKEYSFLEMSGSGDIRYICILLDVFKNDDGYYSSDKMYEVQGGQIMKMNEDLMFTWYQFQEDMMRFHVSKLNAMLEDDANGIKHKPEKEKIELDGEEFKLRWFDGGESKMKNLNVLIFNGSDEEAVDDMASTRILRSYQDRIKPQFSEEAFNNFKSILEGRCKKVYTVSHKTIEKAFEKKDPEVAIFYFTGFYTTDGRKIMEVYSKQTMGIFMLYSTYGYEVKEK